MPRKERQEAWTRDLTLDASGSAWFFAPYDGEYWILNYTGSAVTLNKAAKTTISVASDSSYKFEAIQGDQIGLTGGAAGAVITISSTYDVKPIPLSKDVLGKFVLSDSLGNAAVIAAAQQTNQLGLNVHIDAGDQLGVNLNANLAGPLQTNPLDINNAQLTYFAEATADVLAAFKMAVLPARMNQNATLTNGQLAHLTVDASGNLKTVVIAAVPTVPANHAQVAILPNSQNFHITTNTTTTPFPATVTGWITNINILVRTAGNASTITLQSKDATPIMLVDVLPTTSVQTLGTNLRFTSPGIAFNGLDIITAGTGAAIIDVIVTWFA